VELFKLAGEGVGVGGRELTRSRPLARSSRTFAFSRIPFAVSQTAQVSFAEAADVAASRQSAANMSRNSKMAAFSRKPLLSSRVG